MYDDAASYCLFLTRRERVSLVAFGDVIGQEKVARMLKQALNHDRLAHAYIFSGPDREGKRQMALELAKALNCSTRKNDACNDCTNCVRIGHGNHPDVHWIQPEGQSVKIEQIRLLQKNISYHSVETTVKIFIVEAADTMTLQAANSMLKFLEDPAGRVLAMLLTDNIHAILPTVRSRCQFVRFQYVPPEVMMKRLVKDGVPQALASVASGVASHLQEAQELCEHEWFLDAPRLVTQFTAALHEYSGRAFVIVQEKIMKSEIGKKYMDVFLHLLILWYQDMLTIKLGRRQTFTFFEQIKDVKQQGTKWTEKKIVQAVEQLMFARQQLRQHVPPQLVLEGWVLSVQEG